MAKRSPEQLKPERISKRSDSLTTWRQTHISKTFRRYLETLLFFQFLFPNRRLIRAYEFPIKIIISLLLYKIYIFILPSTHINTRSHNPYILPRKHQLLMFSIVFWDVLPCKMIVNRRFRGAYSLDHQSAHLKRRLTIILHSSTSQKTILNIILAAVRTWNLTSVTYLSNRGTMWDTNISISSVSVPVSCHSLLILSLANYTYKRTTRGWPEVGLCM
jgi:hypothetical protein